MSASLFPNILCCTCVAPGERLFDVKFFPNPVGDEQVFAVAASSQVFVARTKLGQFPPFEILRWWRDFQGIPSGANLNSLVWTQDPESGKPQLCVAGAYPKQLLILDVESGQMIRTLAGHGRGINDVASLSRHMVATASDDYTIRLWNLDRNFEKQPCVAIFAGEGHKQPVLAIGFHANGRWMLSGGIDTALCLWPVPSPTQLAVGHHQSEAVVVYDPHFYSTEVHHNYVDKVMFHGDLILSKCSANAPSNEILLWKIDGFSGDMAVPDEPPTLSDNVHTRSSFSSSGVGPQRRGFQRLLTFEHPNAWRFYNRFDLFHAADCRPILVAGTEKARFIFWDLQRIEQDEDPGDNAAARPKNRRPNSATATENSNRLENLKKREPSVAGNSVARSSTPGRTATDTTTPAERRAVLSDPFTPIRAHHSISASVKLTNGRPFSSAAVGFSPDGRWLISVGDFGMMCVFYRENTV